MTECWYVEEGTGLCFWCRRPPDEHEFAVCNHCEGTTVIDTGTDRAPGQALIGVIRRCHYCMMTGRVRQTNIT